MFKFSGCCRLRGLIDEKSELDGVQKPFVFGQTLGARHDDAEGVSDVGEGLFARTQAVEYERLLGFGQADLPWGTSVFDSVERSRTGATVVTGNQHHVGMALGNAGRDGAEAEAWLTYGLADVVNQRRMIDEGGASEEFKRVQRAKLDALLALAEAHDCRRVRLLAYFGEASQPCGNCDNCLHPPQTWDGTEAARKLLSGIYRFWQHGQQRFGAGHLIDVLRGRRTDKVAQYGHESLSTFGIGSDLSEAQWRAVLRQLIAQGHVVSEGEFNTLGLSASARAVLKGEVGIVLKQAAEPGSRSKPGRGKASASPPIPLDGDALARYELLKAWRAQVAREHNLPAYVVFHDATLAEMARLAPSTLSELATVSGVGAKKLEAYGEQILAVWRG